MPKRERRGLIGGEVGRGTFVRPDVRRRAADADRPRRCEIDAGGFIDLSINFPTPRANDALLSTALAAHGELGRASIRCSTIIIMSACRGIAQPARNGWPNSATPSPPSGSSSPPAASMR